MYDTVDAKDTKKPDNHRNADQNVRNFSISFFPKTYDTVAAYRKHTGGKSEGYSRVYMPARAGIIQRQTMIEYEPGYYDYNYNLRSGGFGNRVTVGKSMYACIDPNESRNGSTASAGGNTHMHLLHYLKNKWGTKIVRGHLLNDHLGGLSVEENLFPISAQANSNHLHKVEGYVKGFTYGRNREFIPQKIIYKVNVFNADDTQQFNEFKPMTQFRCDVEVYVWGSDTPKRVAHYDVDSDISNNTSNSDVAGPFGDDMPYANNIDIRWRTGKNNLEPRPSNGSRYELKRQGTDISLGTVDTKSAPYIESAEDTKFKTKRGWGHMVEAIIDSSISQRDFVEMFEPVKQQIIESRDAKTIQDTLDLRGTQEWFQNIVNDLNIIQDEQTISDELYLQLCSRLIYHLWQEALNNEQEKIEDSAEKQYLECQASIDQILLRSNDADVAEIELGQFVVSSQPVSRLITKYYLSHIIYMAEGHILEELHKEILLLFDILRGSSDTTVIVLAEKFFDGDCSTEHIKWFIRVLAAKYAGDFSSFPMLQMIHGIYGNNIMNANYLCDAIDSITEEISSEIKNNVIRHLTKCDEEQRWGDTEIADGHTLHQVILEQIMLNKNGKYIYQSSINDGIYEKLFGMAYPEAEINKNSLCYKAVKTFLKNKIAAQEKWFVDILFQICYGYLEPYREQILEDSWRSVGDDVLRELTTVYQVLMQIANANLVEKIKDDFVFLNKDLSKDNRLTYYINTTMADYNWRNPLEIAQDQIATESDDGQNKQMENLENLFRRYLSKEIPLTKSLFAKIVYQVASRWTYDYLRLNDDDFDDDYEDACDADLSFDDAD